MNLPVSGDVVDCLAGSEVLNSSVVSDEGKAKQENPWTEFIGMYKEDADFAEMMAEMRAERGIEPHSSIGERFITHDRQSDLA